MFGGFLTIVAIVLLIIAFWDDIDGNGRNLA